MRRFLFLPLVFLVGCVSADELSHTNPTYDADGHRVCDPGRQLACMCVDGSHGAQRCRADGTAWGACVCPGDRLPGQDAAAHDAVSDVDVSSDVTSDVLDGHDACLDADQDASEVDADADVPDVQPDMQPYADADVDADADVSPDVPGKIGRAHV